MNDMCIYCWFFLAFSCIMFLFMTKALHNWKNIVIGYKNLYEKCDENRKFWMEHAQQLSQDLTLTPLCGMIEIYFQDTPINSHVIKTTVDKPLLIKVGDDCGNMVEVDLEKFRNEGIIS